MGTDVTNAPHKRPVVSMLVVHLYQRKTKTKKLMLALCYRKWQTLVIRTRWSKKKSQKRSHKNMRGKEYKMLSTFLATWSKHKARELRCLFQNISTTVKNGVQGWSGGTWYLIVCEAWFKALCMSQWNETNKSKNKHKKENWYKMTCSFFSPLLRMLFMSLWRRCRPP